MIIHQINYPLPYQKIGQRVFLKKYILANTLRKYNRLPGHLLMGMNDFEEFCIAYAYKAD